MHLHKILHVNSLVTICVYQSVRLNLIMHKYVSYHGAQFKSTLQRVCYYQTKSLNTLWLF